MKLMYNLNTKPEALFCICFSFFLLFSCAKQTVPPQENKPDSIIIKKDTIKATDKVTESPLDTIIGKVPMNDFIGANGFHEDEVQNIQAVGFLRAYCNWDWFQGDTPGDPLIFQYSRGGWYFDDAFQKIKDGGIKVVMCFQGAVKNLQGTNNFKFNDKPLDNAGANPTDPKSYTKIANALYQIAARYGRTKVSADKLNVPVDQKFSGLDLLDYIEVWNESDKTWEGDAARFSPEEYAAMLSICYDKIKEADPTMKVAMAGLADASLDYIKRMETWFKNNRADKQFAADVINVHMYAFNNNMDWSNPVAVPAETPEDGHLRKKSEEIVSYTHANMPNREVWISEFGWDTNKDSKLTPKKIAGLSINEVQARWLTRGYLEFAAAGIDRVQMFALTDPSQNYIDTWFGTSGLLDRTLNFFKKPSWYYTKTMKTLLNNMYYAGEVVTGDNQLRLYKFKEKTSGKGAYVIWSNSSDDKSFTYSVKLSGNTKNAELVELTDKKENGTSNKLDIENNSVTLKVTEKPAFILVDQL